MAAPVVAALPTVVRAIAKPNQETLIIIKGVSPKVSNRDAKSVQAISITGAKCL